MRVLRRVEIGLAFLEAVLAGVMIVLGVYFAISAPGAPNAIGFSVALGLALILLPCAFVFIMLAWGMWAGARVAWYGHFILAVLIFVLLYLLGR